MARLQQAVRQGKCKTHYILSQRPKMEVTFMPKNWKLEKSYLLAIKSRWSAREAPKSRCYFLLIKPLFPSEKQPLGVQQSLPSDAAHVPGQHRHFYTVMVSRCSYTEQRFTYFSLSIPAALETWRSYDPCLSELDSKDQKETASGHPCRKRKKKEEREKTGIRATKVSLLSPYS